MTCNPNLTGGRYGASVVSTTSPRSGIDSSSQSHANHTVRLDWFALCDSVCQFRNKLRNMMYILCASFRSYLGHVGSQSAKGRIAVDLGPALQLLSNGQYQANARTLARAEGIRNLRASHPWVDIPDLRMFLMGWDAGERFAHLCYIPAEQTQSEKTESCNQFSKSQMRELIPAAIAGVTRKDECTRQKL